MEDFYCVITFHVTQHALIFEKLMNEKGVPIKLMPVPRQVSSSCGTAAKVPCNLKYDIKKWCEDSLIPIDEFHKVVHQKGKSWFSKYINK